MSDTETLRRALRAGQPGADDLDIGVIMKRGRRLRTRRRLAAVGGAACLAALAFGVLSVTGHATQPSVAPANSGHSGHSGRPSHSAPARVPGSPTPSPTRSRTPAGAPSPARASATPSSAASVTPTPFASRPGPTTTPSPSQGTPSPTAAVTTPARLTGHPLVRPLGFRQTAL